MHAAIRTALAAAGIAAAADAAATITLFEHDGFRGRSFVAQRAVSNFERSGFNDRASSVIVSGDRWEVCDNARFQGRCVVLRPGQYPSLNAMGLNDRVSSVRIVKRGARIDDARYGPAPLVAHDYRRRGREKLFEAQVTSVRAVVGQGPERCWIERERVRDGDQVPAAIAGAVIGGILGHQLGSGRGQDAATVGGAVAGAAIGANLAGDDRHRDVKRCARDPSQARPAYWDVTYRFRGREHRMQTAAPPGRTVLVNAKGEPRV